MPTRAELASIADSLETYRSQLAAISHALAALRLVSDQMISTIERDQAALATHLAQTSADGAERSHQTEPNTSDVLDAIPPVAITDAVVLEAADAHSEEPAATAGEQAQEATPLSAAPPIQVSDTPTAADDADKPAPEAPAQPATVAASAGNVVSLAQKRESQGVAQRVRRRATAVVASLLVTATATVGLHEFMQTDMGQQMMQLATCDGDMLSASRDCALLAWLMI
jgi:hypothetical protein